MPDIKEQRYKRLRKLGKELHIPIPEAFIELEVRDKDGKLIQKHRQRSHSWTRNAYNALFSNLASVNPDDDTYGPGYLSGKDTGGTVRYGSDGVALSSTTYESTGLGFCTELCSAVRADVLLWWRCWRRRKGQGGGRGQAQACN
ncbi:unnamed protein product [marine sediment metagenome]|uniref:Uncharacterized protein n=1 Tax=marine sediment metagenome TaxID=412755 RepID=X1SI98_9ZZZZ